MPYVASGYWVSGYAVDDASGSPVWPLPADVALGVVYGPTGIEYTGTMTGGTGQSADAIAAAVLAALQATTIPVDTKKMNGHTIIGDGSEANPWRGVGVQP